MGNRIERKDKKRPIDLAAIERIFESKEEKMRFREYLLSVYSIEYMTFLGKYHDYRNDFKRKDITRDQLIATAKFIEYHFISRTSPFSLNISGELVGKTLDGLDRIINKDKNVKSTRFSRYSTNRMRNSSEHKRSLPICGIDKDLLKSNNFADIYRDLYEVFDPVYGEVILILCNSHLPHYLEYIKKNNQIDLNEKKLEKNKMSRNMYAQSMSELDSSISGSKTLPSISELMKSCNPHSLSEMNTPEMTPRDNIRTPKNYVFKIEIDSSGCTPMQNISKNTPTATTFDAIPPIDLLSTSKQPDEDDIYVV
jgi:hypothetical protein